MILRVHAADSGQIDGSGLLRYLDGYRFDGKPILSYRTFAAAESTPACFMMESYSTFANFATSSASLLLLSDLPKAAGPPAAAAPFPSFARMTARRIGRTAAYDICRIDGSIYADTASERTILMVLQGF